MLDDPTWLMIYGGAMNFPCPYCAGVIEPKLLGESCPRCGGALCIAGEFLLEEIHGRGGVGTVYGATRTSDRRKVAVKTLRLADAKDVRICKLFEQGSQVLRGLSHPSLPKVYAFERLSSGHLFLVRETFDGGTLFERVYRQQRRLTRAEFRHVLTSMLSLLSYLHELMPPVIHRGIRPKNIIFRTLQDWDPVLADFDTVTAPAGQRNGVELVGSSRYAAPEQQRGFATPASDLYGLGATMLFVATHLDPDLSPHKWRSEVEDLSTTIEPSLRKVLFKMIELEQERRYATAQEVLQDLKKG